MWCSIYIYLFFSVTMHVYIYPSSSSIYIYASKHKYRSGKKKDNAVTRICEFHNRFIPTDTRVRCRVLLSGDVEGEMRSLPRTERGETAAAEAIRHALDTIRFYYRLDLRPTFSAKAEWDHINTRLRESGRAEITNIGDEEVYIGYRITSNVRVTRALLLALAKCIELDARERVRVKHLSFHSPVFAEDVRGDEIVGFLARVGKCSVVERFVDAEGCLHARMEERELNSYYSAVLSNSALVYFYQGFLMSERPRSLPSDARYTKYKGVLLLDFNERIARITLVSANTPQYANLARPEADEVRAWDSASLREVAIEAWRKARKAYRAETDLDYDLLIPPPPPPLGAAERNDSDRVDGRGNGTEAPKRPPQTSTEALEASFLETLEAEFAQSGLFPLNTLQLHDPLQAIEEYPTAFNWIYSPQGHTIGSAPTYPVDKVSAFRPDSLSGSGPESLGGRTHRMKEYFYARWSFHRVMDALFGRNMMRANARPLMECYVDTHEVARLEKFTIQNADVTHPLDYMKLTELLEMAQTIDLENVQVSESYLGFRHEGFSDTSHYLIRLSTRYIQWNNNASKMPQISCAYTSYPILYPQSRHVPAEANGWVDAESEGSVMETEMDTSNASGMSVEGMEKGTEDPDPGDAEMALSLSSRNSDIQDATAGGSEEEGLSVDAMSGVSSQHSDTETGLDDLFEPLDSGGLALIFSKKEDVSSEYLSMLDNYLSERGRAPRDGPADMHIRKAVFSDVTYNDDVELDDLSVIFYSLIEQPYFEELLIYDTAGLMATRANNERAEAVFYHSLFRGWKPGVHISLSFVIEDFVENKYLEDEHDGRSECTLAIHERDDRYADVATITSSHILSLCVVQVAGDDDKVNNEHRTPFAEAMKTVFGTFNYANASDYDYLPPKDARFSWVYMQQGISKNLGTAGSLCLFVSGLSIATPEDWMSFEWFLGVSDGGFPYKAGVIKEIVLHNVSIDGFLTSMASATAEIYSGLESITLSSIYSHPRMEKLEDDVLAIYTEEFIKKTLSAANEHPISAQVAHSCLKEFHYSMEFSESRLKRIVVNDTEGFGAHELADVFRSSLADGGMLEVLKNDVPKFVRDGTSAPDCEVTIDGHSLEEYLGHIS